MDGKPPKPPTEITRTKCKGIMRLVGAERDALGKSLFTFECHAYKQIDAIQINYN